MPPADCARSRVANSITRETDLRSGIAVRPGAIDFSALAGLVQTSSLVRRATAAETTRRMWIIIGIISLVALIAGGIFCCIVLALMRRKKQQRKKRNLDLGASNRNHAYRPVEDMELGYTGVQEMPAENSFGGGGRKTELGGYANEVPRVQQLDGFVAPAKPSAAAVELPASYKDEHR